MSTADERLRLRVRALFGERRDERAARHDVVPPQRGPAAQPTRREPYATLTVGGPLDGTVTLTASDSSRVIVEATWGDRENRKRISLTRPSEREALILADHWACQLIDCREPARDRLPPPKARYQ